MKALRLSLWLAVLIAAGSAWYLWSAHRTPQTQPLPALTLERMEGRAGFDPAAIEGVWMLNVWASWCAPCRIEHPALMALQAEGYAIYGLNLRDAAEDADRYLDELGDPYRAVMADPDGDMAAVLGMDGPPATLVILDGEVWAVWPGPITADALRHTLYPALEAAGRADMRRR